MWGVDRDVERRVCTPHESATEKGDMRYVNNPLAQVLLGVL